MGDPIQGNLNHETIISADHLGEYAQDPTFQSFVGKPFGEYLKSFKNAQSMVGADKLIVPAGKLDTPEHWGSVFDKLGRPKDISGYEFARPELPEGMQFNEDFENKMRPLFHYLGLLPWQAKGLSEAFTGYQVDGYKKYMEDQAKLQTDQAAKDKEIEDALVKKLGTKENYDKYVKDANDTFKKFCKDEKAAAAFLEKYGADPLVVDVFGEVAKAMSESAAHRGNSGTGLADDVTKAQTDVKDIMHNKENPLNKAYFDGKHPRHKEAVEEVARLHALIHGAGDNQ